MVNKPKVVFDSLGFLRRHIAGELGLLDDNKDSYMQTMSYKMAYAAACSKVYIILTFLSVIGFILTFFIPAEPQEF